MAVHDGPGIRTTVFFKGCPLRCWWCHNPEGFISEPQLMYKSSRCLHCGQCQTECDHADCEPFGRCIYICPENCLEIAGKQVTAKELAKELKQSAKVLGERFGGFTFSGGEPLAQPKFLFELIEELRSVVKNAINNIDFKSFSLNQAKVSIVKAVRGYLGKSIKRRPMVLPIIYEN